MNTRLISLTAFAAMLAFSVSNAAEAKPRGPEFKEEAAQPAVTAEVTTPATETEDDLSNITPAAGAKENDPIKERQFKSR